MRFFFGILAPVCWCLPPAACRKRRSSGGAGIQSEPFEPNRRLAISAVRTETSGGVASPGSAVFGFDRHGGILRQQRQQPEVALQFKHVSTTQSQATAGRNLMSSDDRQLSSVICTLLTLSSVKYSQKVAF